MCYKQLYEQCSHLDLPVNRNTIRDKIKEIAKIERISYMRTTLDTTICRGIYLSARNKSHRWVKQHGSHVIAVARGLDPILDRFIFVKEMMHLFDDPLEATDSGDAFERLLIDMSSPGSTVRSSQFSSEVKCFWMALGVLCPESHRDQLEKERSDDLKDIDDYQISLRLKIPEAYAQRLFQANFRDIIKTLTEKTA